MMWHETPGPLDTSLEYFYSEIQGKNREMMTLCKDNTDYLTAGWILKTARAQLIIEDRVRGPFPLYHLDLHYGNLLFDDEFNLTGVIDWSNAQAAPLEQLSVCPELMTFPGLSEEENRPIIEFKNLLIQFLKEMEKEKEDMQSSDLTPLSTYMASKSADITLRQYMASPRGLLFAGREVAKLMYGEKFTWEQLREVYSVMPLLQIILDTQPHLSDLLHGNLRAVVVVVRPQELLILHEVLSFSAKVSYNNNLVVI